MWTLVLGARRRQRHGRFVEIDFAPPQAANLGPTASGQNQQLDNFAVLTVAGRVPDRRELRVGQDTLPRTDLCRFVGEGRGVGLDVTLLRRPAEKGTQRRSNPITRRRTVVLGNRRQQRREHSTIDRLNRMTMKWTSVSLQVPRCLLMGSGFQPVTLTRQEPRQQGADRVGHFGPRGHLLAGWIATQPNASQ